MPRWTGVVLALTDAGDDEMTSRLPAWLHPVSGRPLIWHTVWSLAKLRPRPRRVQVISVTELATETFEGLPVDVDVVVLSAEERQRFEPEHTEPDSSTLVIEAAASAPIAPLQALLAGDTGGWIESDTGRAVAAWLDWGHLTQLLRLPDPFHTPNGVLAARQRLPGGGEAMVVRDRAQLAVATRRVHDRLIRALMEGGATFLLPDTVLVDVDVRIGRDSVVYPGVVLEGQTTVGEETVIGPGCRIIDSWVGSGVELKGWNYISHTSVRNRAILEPYVRRGFD